MAVAAAHWAGRRFFHRSMDQNKKSIWFPAKTYGWGWGPPCAWQGWVVLVSFVALLGTSAWLLLPGKHIGWFFIAEAVLVTALIAICFWKGERPRWRWGKD
jgi:hypothetical protein